MDNNAIPPRPGPGKHECLIKASRGRYYSCPHLTRDNKCRLGEEISIQHRLGGEKVIPRPASCLASALAGR